jgi:hypothetical protein
LGLKKGLIMLTKIILSVFYGIKKGDAFLILEPKNGYSEIESVNYYTLTNINGYCLTLHSEILNRYKYLRFRQIVELKRAQFYLEMTLPNVPSREYLKKM